MDGYERIKEPALYVGDIDCDDGNMDLGLPPTSGEEYIRRVMSEARKCDDVAYAKIDEKRLKKPTLNVKPLPECEQAPEGFRPTVEWQKSQENAFSDLRLYISQIRDEITNERRKPKRPDKQLPDPQYPKAWLEACTVSDGNEAQYIEPTLTVILALNQQSVEQVLEHLVEYLENEKTIEPPTGRWLYALLAALELPLDPDICSLLRSLARICSRMRSQLDTSSTKEATSLNLFICIVARYFRQLDLADP